MPVPDQRDPELTRAVLEGWLTGRLPDARVERLETPSTSGFSAETLLFTAGGADYVAKVAPTGYQIFPEPRFEEQYEVLRELRSRGLLVPEVFWYEPDASLLGAPFFVMAAYPGRAPSDMPTYHQEGWVTEIGPDERGALWDAGLRAMASIHHQDVKGLEYVDQTKYGPTGWVQRVAYWEHYLSWGYSGKVPVADRALEWLRANAPVEERPPGLLWGDSRIGNLLFVEGEVTAILDWEMVTLGQPEEDLSWYLYLDRHHKEAVGSEGLPGFPTREETIARYAGLLGRDLDDLRPYDVLSGLKFAAVMARIGQLFIHYGLVGPDDPFPYDNTATRVLENVLDELS
ncbi:aminoglycoside phosphotransferase (APT) family kinase protein [Actinocorallia herbida]|uniref:Aminoglycoside phosphotransferase (APT) family kinase protein n=1 Tax=Actinocorallia herbida TaxID=58109 RepID=A0A3N1D8P8_9ACTN|nr:phosphotransferase family protein [Actinocorallia herbida]ROO89912.1 aminoglycoside phosphotransferase (APT) family kinase protein [Actinocorallia herbida]